MPTSNTRPCLAVLAASAAMLGCSEPEVGDGPVTALVLAHTEIDLATGVPSYELQERELSTMEDLETLRGRFHRVFRGGELLIEDVAGSVVVGRFEGPASPDLRYEIEDGTIVARDYPTLAMLSAFYQFESVIVALDALTDLSPEELTSGGPLEIFFEPSIVVEGSVDATQTLKFNAFYLPDTEQFGLAQRSPIEALPLATSPVVIAHEFGHRVFDRAFFDDSRDGCAADANDALFPGRLAVEYAISGLNEGYADFLSFSLHGSTNPLGEYSFAAERNFRDTGFSYDDYAFACDGLFYCIGTLFARSLYETLEESGLDPTLLEDRQSFSREVYRALETTQSRMADVAELLPPPSATVLRCERSASPAMEYDGQVVGAFLHAFVRGMPAERQAALCERLIANYGSAGFPEEARSACP